MMPLKNARVTYPYGVKNSRYSKGYHTGIDLAADDYTEYAVVPGTVQEARYAPGRGADPDGWGNYVIVRTIDGKYDLIYAHMANVKVSKAEQVSEGTVLGIMGSTGSSTGPHLHFEVRKVPWQNRNDIDPAAWLGIKNVVGPAISVPAEREETMFKNLVLCNPGVDERAASYLADRLKAPRDILANVDERTLKCAEVVYVIGSQDKPVANCVNIVGSDRYDTCAQVLKICQGR